MDGKNQVTDLPAPCPPAGRGRHGLIWVLLLAISCLPVGTGGGVWGATPDELATVLVHIGPPQDRYSQSGVVLAADGLDALVITAAHSYREAPTSYAVHIHAVGHDPAPAKLLYASDADRSDCDIAILWVRGTVPYVAVPLAAADPSPRLRVWQVGYPRGSHQQHRRDGEILGYENNWLRVSFDTAAGDSGSPIYTQTDCGPAVVGQVWGSREGSWANPPTRIRSAMETQCQGAACTLWPRQQFWPAPLSPRQQAGLPMVPVHPQRPATTTPNPRPPQSTPDPSPQAPRLPLVAAITALDLADLEKRLGAKLEALQACQCAATDFVALRSDVDELKGRAPAASRRRRGTVRIPVRGDLR